MYLSGFDAIGFYTNIQAFVILLALITLSKRLITRKRNEDRLFLYLCLAVMGDCTFGVMYFATRAIMPDSARFFLTLFSTGGSLCVLLELFLWLLYVDYKCNQSWDYLKRHYALGWIPLAAIVVLLIINIFTGIVFNFDENMDVHVTAVYNLVCLAELSYFLFAGVVFLRNRGKNSLGRLFRITPIFLPVFTASVAEYFMFDSILSLGCTVALIFLYFSQAEGRQYDDEVEEGVFNRSYLARIVEEVAKESRDIKSAIIISAEKIGGNDLVEQLKMRLPTGAELVRINEKKFAFFSSHAGKRALRTMCKMLEDVGKGYDVKCTSHIREEKDAANWIEDICNQDETQQNKSE